MGSYLAFIFISSTCIRTIVCCVHKLSTAIRTEQLGIGDWESSTIGPTYRVRLCRAKTEKELGRIKPEENKKRALLLVSSIQPAPLLLPAERGRGWSIYI